jgi:NAD(P)-dependent dehydrogenase (short-subunit alcohol dehydrogenase family)
MGKLDGGIALITGGNSGIGLATAKRFVNEGAYVFITGRREAELAAAAREIEKNVTGVQGDVSNLGDLDCLFAQIKREKGKLDIVFANAGVATYAPTANSVYSATKAGGFHGHWRRALKVAFESSSTREVGHAR